MYHSDTVVVRVANAHNTDLTLSTNIDSDSQQTIVDLPFDCPYSIDSEPDSQDLLHLPKMPTFFELFDEPGNISAGFRIVASC